MKEQKAKLIILNSNHLIKIPQVYLQPFIKLFLYMIEFFHSTPHFSRNRHSSLFDRQQKIIYIQQ